MVVRLRRITVRQGDVAIFRRESLVDLADIEGNVAGLIQQGLSALHRLLKLGQRRMWQLCEVLRDANHT